jgi:hypothetical protein
MLLDTQKVLVTLLSVLLFVVVSLPWTYQLTNMVFGKLFKTAEANGCPTAAGLALHAVVFGLLVYGTMFVPWERLGEAVGLNV